jgi:hypothetical protein
MPGPFDQSKDQQNNLTATGPSGFDAPIPGESLTGQPQKYPYERPPEMVDPEEILNYIFRRLTQRQAVFKTLSAMDMGIPIGTLTENLILTGAAEGLWPAHTGLLCAPAVSVMLYRMAERAGIKPRMSSTAPPVQGAPPSEIMSMARKRISSGQVDAAAETADAGKRDIASAGKMSSTKLGLAVPVGNSLKGVI